MSAWAMGKLRATVKSELHPVFTGYSKDLFRAMDALATACGEKSVILLCDKLFTLINSSYVPGSSLAEHATLFRKQYTSLKMSTKSIPNFMYVSTGMAAALLLRSLNQDDSLSPLVQNLYDLNPLTFEKVYDRLLIEETRKDSAVAESAYFSNQNKRFGKQPSSRSTSGFSNRGSTSGFSNRGSTSNRGSHRGGNVTRGSFRGVTPTRSAPKSSEQNADVVSRQFAQMFDAQMKKFIAGNADMINENKEDDCDEDAEYEEDNYVDEPDDGCFAIFEEVNVNGLPIAPKPKTLILDSGASKTTLCDFNLLIDPQPITKFINTYSGSINITHAGKFNLGGTLIYPAFYAPNGPRNLVSVSQLEDHGLKVVGKNRMFLIKLGQRIIYRFPRVGSLYEGQIPKNNTSNYVMSISEPDPNFDYHILLGHPSDEYLIRFFRLHGITPVNSGQSAKNCEVCKRCKLKRAPHSNPLPTTDRPFKTLHMDVLQISPPSKSSMKYVLVIIDDYSRFNRIYLMRNKSESEGKILSYINEIVNKTGIRVEAGPANNPQTNGLAERFNQALLVKIRCLLAQSAIPINFWDEAAKYASTLINILPSKALNWSSPVSVLSELNSCIEPIRDLNKLIPFGLKVYVSHRPPSKVSAPSTPLLCLGYQDHSDAFRFFDPLKRHIVISRDYSPMKLAFEYNSPASLRKPPDTLPKAIVNHRKSDDEFGQVRFAPISSSPSKDKTPLQTIEDPSHAKSSPSSSNVEQDPSTGAPPNPPVLSASSTTSKSTSKTKSVKPSWGLVPAHEPPNRHIVGDVGAQNIIAGSRRQGSKTSKSVVPPSVSDPPDQLLLLHFDYPEYIFLTESVTLKEALENDKEVRKWEEAMAKEHHSLTSKNTGTLVPPPGDDRVIGGMWLLGRKKNEFGDVLRFKARWVCFGNHQVHMLHYFDTYASVARNESFKLLLTVAVNQCWSVFQFDVETAFLYGEIDAPVYVSQIKGFEEPGKENWVWRLNKSLYGTKQAPRQWRKHLVATLTRLGLESSLLDESLFYNNDRSIFLHMHVDDGFLIGESREDVMRLLDAIGKTYTIKVKERPSQHLGYTLDWKEDASVHINQADFINKILYDFDMHESNPVRAPAPMNLHKLVATDAEPINQRLFQKAIGMLNYLALHTRPDITFAVNLLAQFTSNPNEAHWSAVKHLLRYLRGTSTMGIHYTHSSDPDEGLCGWADADYATSLVTKKSTSGYVITMYGNPICWSTKKQPVVAQSTTEAEFVAINRCAKQLRWLTNLVLSLHIKIKAPIMKNDNSGAVIISKEAQLNENTKHIEVRFQYVLELVAKKQITVVQVSTHQMIADGLTKPLGWIKLEASRAQLHLTDSESRRSVRV
ncbi:hypothetical protein Pst134EA_033418 [Puccinia striiformis f. sp. tritici]|uniref:hypothetical protein n=1 Tax=Puccinia striiformis f. sp. tritici TaxID=168172 RepID=UPI002007FBFC|nr:hypothetical protein Pst134EA_033418 [Puccinia striiformis f. sp. tritici]KAH9468237.1 hypothetical protein Pst134EA_033418 [Puccinia striiformis f. sp. tritici]